MHLSALKAIRFGKLIDGTGKVWTNAIVIVKGDRIQSVGEAGAPIPSDAQVIDMSAFTGMPGLIDIHTHMTYWWSGNPHTTPNAETARLLPQELVFMAQENARKTLDIGVTTVRDMAAKNYSDIAMRNLINRGAMVGPRMFVAGPAMTRGWARSALWRGFSVDRARARTGQRCGRSDAAHPPGARGRH